MDKQYFITVRANRSNSLGEYVSKIVKEKFDHMLISEEHWKGLVRMVKDTIADGEKKYSRCMPLRLDEYSVGAELYGGSTELYGEHPRLSYTKDTYDSTAAFVIDTYVVRKDLSKIE